MEKPTSVSRNFFSARYDRDWFRARFEQRAEIVQPFFRQHDGGDGELAFEQPPDDLDAFGHEDALRLVFHRTLHRGVRPEFGRIERGDFFNSEHFEDFCLPLLNRKGENSGKFSTRIG